MTAAQTPVDAPVRFEHTWVALGMAAGAVAAAHAQLVAAAAVAVAAYARENNLDFVRFGWHGSYGVGGDVYPIPTGPHGRALDSLDALVARHVRPAGLGGEWTPGRGWRPALCDA